MPEGREFREAWARFALPMLRFLAPFRDRVRSTELRLARHIGVLGGTASAPPGMVGPR